MVSPATMCRKHLLGEHVEIHMAVASLRLGKSVDGFVAKGLLQLEKLRSRHDELVREMETRGYRHNSPLGEVPRRRGGKVDRQSNARELARRCGECRRLMKSLLT
ncbi:MAG TPA: pyrimidine dimer DNA glycosylase/endonuclease V [Terriglobales bacterium]|nr:pyrimidine dimer DNA glycosylase/endonuclease V [Terriglobales bacterium]